MILTYKLGAGLNAQRGKAKCAKHVLVSNAVYSTTGMNWTSVNVVKIVWNVQDDLSFLYCTEWLVRNDINLIYDDAMS